MTEMLSLEWKWLSFWLKNMNQFLRKILFLLPILFKTKLWALYKHSDMFEVLALDFDLVLIVNKFDWFGMFERKTESGYLRSMLEERHSTIILKAKRESSLKRKRP